MQEIRHPQGAARIRCRSKTPEPRSWKDNSQRPPGAAMRDLPEASRPPGAAMHGDRHQSQAPARDLPEISALPEDNHVHELQPPHRGEQVSVGAKDKAWDLRTLGRGFDSGLAATGTYSYSRPAGAAMQSANPPPQTLGHRKTAEQEHVSVLPEFMPAAAADGFGEPAQHAAQRTNPAQADPGLREGERAPTPTPTPCRPSPVRTDDGNSRDNVATGDASTSKSRPRSSRNQRNFYWKCG